MDDYSRISPNKLRNFFKHICIVAGRYKDRELANSNFKKQVRRTKSIPKEPKKGRIDQEVKKLEDTISEVLDKETKLRKAEKKQGYEVKELKERVKLLEEQLEATKRSRDIQLSENRAKIKKLIDRVANLKSQVDKLVEIKIAKQRRETELDRKIRAVTGL